MDMRQAEEISEAELESEKERLQKRSEELRKV